MTYSDLSELTTQVKCIYMSNVNILGLIILFIKGQTITYSTVAFGICKDKVSQRLTNFRADQVSRRETKKKTN